MHVCGAILVLHQMMMMSWSIRNICVCSVVLCFEDFCLNGRRTAQNDGAISKMAQFFLSKFTIWSTTVVFAVWTVFCVSVLCGLPLLDRNEETCFPYKRDLLGGLQTWVHDRDRVVN